MAKQHRTKYHGTKINSPFNLQLVEGGQQIFEEVDEKKQKTWTQDAWMNISRDYLIIT